VAYKLGAHSEMLLRGVHPDLVKVIRRAIQITKIDFKVLEGVRSVARQRELVKKGASQTMKSRHINGFAVDIAPFVAGQVRWDWPLYFQLAATVKQAAKDVGVPVEWGGDWKTFKDGPHWQLPARKYPDPK
jgi:peptidoglycan L-alanyl-D-glutamate endopeptidase CwlK